MIASRTLDDCKSLQLTYYFALNRSGPVKGAENL